MAKYKFEYDDSEVLRKVTHEIETYKDLSNILEEFSIFLRSITYGTYGLINTRNEDEFNAVEEFLERYRKNKNEHN